MGEKRLVQSDIYISDLFKEHSLTKKKKAGKIVDMVTITMKP